MTVIIDYGLGNVRSIRTKLEQLKIPASISSDPGAILNASHLILPGVGHFATGMKNLRDRNLISCLNEAVLNRKIPILGICLGMQLLAQGSEEGDCEGLGWIEGRVRRFDFENNRLRVPHVGFNEVKLCAPFALLEPQPTDPYFYFTHSYHLVAEKNVIGKTVHGYEFASIVQKQNIVGCQFHPEKSREQGMLILARFCGAKC